MNCRDWVERFREDYFDRGGTEVTWRSEYQKVLKHLPPNEALTPALLHELVRRSKPNTRTRVRFCMVAGQIAKFSGIDYDPKKYRGKYRPEHPREIPSDHEIVETWNMVIDPGWRWVVAMMATYGLRNHEVFRLDYQAIRSGHKAVRVLSGKTGDRLVFPFHPEWWDRFGLQSVELPGIDMSRDNEAVGHSVTEYFSDHTLPFNAYDLRHAYAIRTLKYQVDLTIAAKWMGHSREVHEKVYRRWIDEELLKAEYDRALSRGDRPRPPSI